VTTKRPDPQNPRCAEVPEKPGSSSGDISFRGLLKGRFRGLDAVGEKECSAGRKWVYICPDTKKLTPAITGEQFEHCDLLEGQ
jgi:hypothetical protein